MPAAIDRPPVTKAETEAFLNSLYDLDPQLDIETGTDFIFEHVDSLLSSGRFRECDELLDGVEVKRLSPAWMRSLLTATKPAEIHLSRRKALVTRISSALDKVVGSDSRERLLRNVV